MGTVHFISKEIREQILTRIKNDGIPVSQAAKEHGVNLKTVYNWMYKTTTNSPSIFEISRLRRENKELKEIIGMIIHFLYVRIRLRDKKWSPETIAGRLPVDYPGYTIDDETIYRYVYGRKQRRMKLWEHLVLHRRKRMKKYGRKALWKTPSEDCEDLFPKEKVWME